VFKIKNDSKNSNKIIGAIAAKKIRQKEWLK